MQNNQITQKQMKKLMNTNDFGEKILVENCSKICISDVLKEINPLIKKALIESQLSARGLNINLLTSKTGFGGKRFWMACPICSKRAGVLYIHPISNITGCRTCLNLEYKQRRYKGMIEALDDY